MSERKPEHLFRVVLFFFKANYLLYFLRQEGEKVLKRFLMKSNYLNDE